MELVKISNANTTSVEATKICPSILSSNVLHMQSNLLKITIKFNVTTTMEVPFNVNPLIWLLCTLKTYCILRRSLLEFLKLAKFAIVQVLGLVEDEKTFSTLSFMKSKLKNYFNKHLHTITRMYSQTFYILDTFPYGTCFDD